MFGSRGAYREYFQLWIPTTLLKNWTKCFSFHKLAIQAMRSKAGAPVWLSDHKTTPTSASSIDKSTVDFEGGEMSFGLFSFDKKLHEMLMDRGTRTDQEMLDDLHNHFSYKEFPDYLYDYLMHDLTESKSNISFHRASGFGTAASNYTPDEIENIRRKKGIFANNEFARSEQPDARHHLKIFHNGKNMARLFYKINGNSIKFIQNRK